MPRSYDGACGTTSRSKANAPLVAIPRYTCNQYCGSTRRLYRGGTGEIMDAFVFGGVDLGDIPVQAKLGPPHRVLGRVAAPRRRGPRANADLSETDKSVSAKDMGSLAAHADDRRMRPPALAQRLAAITTLCAGLSACAPTAIPQPPVRQACLTDTPFADPTQPHAGKLRIPAGRTTLGAQALRAEEGPRRDVDVAAFWIDRTDVTNAQFAAFVEATGYVSVAERLGNSLVFVDASGSVDISDPGQWWRVVKGASWQQPMGPGSTIEGRETLPVVHVAFEDAQAYARWLGADLPTEAEWEVAARGGIVGARYAWGNAQPDGAAPRANIWQGLFPLADSGGDGYKAQASPVGCFPANGFGLYDMAGNVWQWTKDEFRAAPVDPGTAPRQAIKGGSFLCADNYCLRYRPAARTGAGRAESSSHIGFRTVRREPGEQRLALASTEKRP